MDLLQQEAFDEAKRELMAKFGITADKAEQAMQVGFEKLSQLMPELAGAGLAAGKNVAESLVALINQGKLPEMRRRAMDAVAKLRETKERAVRSASFEVAPRRNKFV